MLRRAAWMAGTVVLSAMLAASVMAQAVPHILMLGGENTIYADTDGDGCPGSATDARCSATSAIVGGNPVGSQLVVDCGQPGSPPLSQQVFGVWPSAEYKFYISEFDLTNMSARASQVSGTFTFSAAQFISGHAFIQQGAGGPVGMVNIVRKNHTSIGALCMQGGNPVAEVLPESGPALLRNLDYVNCGSCPGTACSADSSTPTHLRVSALLPSNSVAMSFITANVFIPLTGKTLAFSDEEPIGDPLDLTKLGACPALLGFGTHQAPSLTLSGLLLLGVGLLAVGSWLIGRRPAFAASIPLP